ncbi:hypothetical protein DMA15_12660 [Streptomyces sp. WAC 01529]|uniref:hypothetical protein n=1 Tax=Streptomyces sp. WAC 01529 TaxID=2203205 RepID=UPI000F6C3709|nr:hypothetical protein [Streptomyces sp. WAC 01529]AZM53333.1 hypothetical protein DMA15_12660 [Streptomyces sp. WAC 01529]
MRTRTLPKLPGIESAPGWLHPYPTNPLSPFLYADGGDGDNGDGDDNDDQDDDAGGDDKPDKGKGDDDGKDWKAEAEKWKAQARKHETRAKENSSAAKERDQLRRDGLPEQERKIEEAVGKALAEERAKNGGKLARQGFLAAAKGLIPNASDVADDVNLSRYVNDDGEVDEDGLAELVKRLAPKASDTDDEDDDEGDGDGGRDTRRGGRGDRRGFDQGARGGRSKDRQRSSVAAGRDLYAERHKKTNT